MTLTRDGSKIYWTKGETITIKLLSDGMILEDPVDKKSKRFFGKLGAKHINTEPIFDGHKTTFCKAAYDDCPWCASGKKQIHEVWGIAIETEGKRFDTTFSLALNHALAYKMRGIEMGGDDPLKYLYKITKTGLRGRDAWEIEGIAPVVPEAEKKEKKPAENKELTPTELHLLEIVKEAADEKDTKKDFIEALNKRGFGGRSEEVYNKYIKQ